MAFGCREDGFGGGLDDLDPFFSSKPGPGSGRYGGFGSSYDNGGSYNSGGFNNGGGYGGGDRYGGGGGYGGGFNNGPGYGSPRTGGFMGGGHGHGRHGHDDDDGPIFRRGLPTRNTDL